MTNDFLDLTKSALHSSELSKLGTGALSPSQKEKIGSGDKGISAEQFKNVTTDQKQTTIEEATKETPDSFNIKDYDEND